MFFVAIRRNKLNTGIQAKKKTLKSVEILNEDKHAFGLIVAKSSKKNIKSL